MAWIIQNDELINTDFVNVPDKPFHGDSPYTFWRIDPNANEGMPYVGLMIGVPVLAPEPPPVPVDPVPQKDYITIHDMRTAQNNFNNHGICVLDPTQCKITEQLNGEYSAYLEHPIDDFGKWKYILEFNILKIQGQLFVIYKVNHTFNGSGGSVKAWARHIFYALNDRWIFQGVGAASTNPEWLLNAMYQLSSTKGRVGDVIYNYTNSTDIPASQTLIDNWQKIDSGMTFGEFLLGNGGFCEVLDGELYRDNFYFSVNQRKEYTDDNAFEIRVGLNLKGIQREVDTSQFCTYLTGYDNFGNSYSVSLATFSFPHHIVREATFRYDEANMNQLKADTNALFNQNKKLKVVYDIDLYDVRNNPDYAELTGFPDYTVGNRGYIYDERLERITGSNRLEVRVTKKITDGITGEVLEVQFGDKTSLTHPAYGGSRRLTREQVLQLKRETQAAIKALGTWNEVFNYTWGEIPQFTWNELNGGA